MAILTSNNVQSMSSNHAASMSRRAARKNVNIQASAYVVDAVSGELNGMHYSSTTCGAGGSVNSIGSSDSEGSSRSSTSSSSSGASAAYTITEECERLFCGTLADVFLGEGKVSAQDPLEMGAFTIGDHGRRRHDDGDESDERCGIPPDNYGLPGSAIIRGPIPLPTPPSSVSSTGSMLAPGMHDDHKATAALEAQAAPSINGFVEIWSYASGLRFRGFVGAKPADRASCALFVFFESDVLDKDLKRALMTLLELASSSELGCDSLVACLDRAAEPGHLDDLVRDLGWVGFEAITLEPWCASGDTPVGPDRVTSDRWLLLAMDV